MLVSKFDRLLRWGVLISVLLNIAFNYLSVQGKINGTSIEEVSLQYENSFTPAGFTFSIWNLIYLFFISYSIYQLHLGRKGNAVYTLIAAPFIGVNLLSMLWLILYSFGYIGLSLFVILAMVVSGYLQFRCARNAAHRHHTKKWITVTFSLFFGWISVASLANFSSWVVAFTGKSTPSVLSMLLICIAVIAAVFITIRYSDWILSIRHSMGVSRYLVSYKRLLQPGCFIGSRCVCFAAHMDHRLCCYQFFQITTTRILK